MTSSRNMECLRSLTACTAGSIRLARDRPVVAGHRPFSKPHSGGGLGYGRPAYSPHRQFPPVSGTSKTVGIRSCRALSPAVQRVRAGLQPLRAPFHRGSAERRAITPPRLPSETPSGWGDGRLRRRCLRALGLPAPGQQLAALLRSAQRGRRRARGAARVRDARLPPERLPAAGGPAPSPTSLPAPGHPRTSDARVCVC